MRYVHSRGIIHRDLTPANILLDANARGLICDFGLSRWGSAEGLPSLYAGTLQYAAPEQWAPTGPYTNKVDVFTFGLVAYELVTGWLPSPQTRSSELRYRSDLFGPLMSKLIGQCWSSTPSERPSFEAILNEFEVNHWAVLPGADAKHIADYVSTVISKENMRTHTQSFGANK
jgi:serine/threonine protein kinase